MYTRLHGTRIVGHRKCCKGRLSNIHIAHMGTTLDDIIKRLRMFIADKIVDIDYRQRSTAVLTLCVKCKSESYFSSVTWKTSNYEISNLDIHSGL